MRAELRKKKRLSMNIQNSCKNLTLPIKTQRQSYNPTEKIQLKKTQVGTNSLQS